MKYIWKLFIGVTSFLCFLFILIYATDNSHLIKAVRETYLKGQNTSNIRDWKAHPKAIILKSKDPKNFTKSHAYNKILLTEALENKLQKDQSISFIVVKDGNLLFEKFWENSSEASLTNSFSMSKAVVTLLLGFAIEEGYIKSLDQPITDFLPEYRELDYAKEVKIIDLSQMTSGIDWGESYKNPVGATAKAYYGDNLEKLVFSKSFTNKAGKEFLYLSANTQLLAIILRRATKKNLAQYAEEKLWDGLKMTQSALWGLDEKGVEKGFCCLYADAITFAKLGQFLLQEGQWEGKQLLSKAFVRKMTHPNALSSEYGQGLWMDYESETPFFSFVGHLGQYIIVVPKENLVIVRLGKKNDNTLHKEKEHLREEIYFYINEVIKSNLNRR